jgi:hypothetical protein
MSLNVPSFYMVSYSLMCTVSRLSDTFPAFSCTIVINYDPRSVVRHCSALMTRRHSSNNVPSSYYTFRIWKRKCASFNPTLLSLPSFPAVSDKHLRLFAVVCITILMAGELGGYKRIFDLSGTLTNAQVAGALTIHRGSAPDCTHARCSLTQI